MKTSANGAHEFLENERVGIHGRPLTHQFFVPFVCFCDPSILILLRPRQLFPGSAAVPDAAIAKDFPLRT